MPVFVDEKMNNKDKSCCANPPEPQLDEDARRALRNFVIGFIVVLVAGGILIYLLRETGWVRHLYMSPQEMEEHFQKQ
jgi:hypothetical protein